MSAPSPIPGRGRGVARRRGFRQKPLCRKGAEAPEEEADGPEHVYVLPNTWHPMPPMESPDPARARWIEKLLADPAGARRERLEARISYWRARLQALERRVRDAREECLSAAADPAAPAAVKWDLEAAHGAAWADCQAALAQVAALERELADA